MRLRLSTRMLILIAVPITLQVALLILFAWVHRLHTRAEGWLSHSKDVIREVERAAWLVVEAQSAIRGYAATGDSRFAQPHDDSAAELPTCLRRLRELTVAVPDQSAQAADIERLAREATAWYRETQRMVDAGDRAGALQRLATQLSKLGFSKD